MVSPASYLVNAEQYCYSSILICKMPSQYFRRLSTATQSSLCDTPDQRECPVCSFPFDLACSWCQIHLDEEVSAQRQSDADMQLWLDEQLARLPTGTDIETSMLKRDRKVPTERQEEYNAKDKFAESGVFGPWLDDLLQNTVDGQAHAEAFHGGADFENPTSSDCRLCFRPVGDETSQHFRKCEYAHKEQEELEISKYGIAGARKRRARRHRRKENFVAKPAFSGSHM